MVATWHFHVLDEPRRHSPSFPSNKRATHIVPLVKGAPPHVTKPTAYNIWNHVRGVLSIQSQTRQKFHNTAVENLRWQLTQATTAADRTWVLDAMARLHTLRRASGLESHRHRHRCRSRRRAKRMKSPPYLGAGPTRHRLDAPLVGGPPRAPAAANVFPSQGTNDVIVRGGTTCGVRAVLVGGLSHTTPPPAAHGRILGGAVHGSAVRKYAVFGTPLIVFRKLLVLFKMDVLRDSFSP